MRMEEEIRVENFQSMQEEEIAADKRRHEEQIMRLQQLEQESRAPLIGKGELLTKGQARLRHHLP